LLFHCVFATKDRRALIPAELQPRFWAYICGIAREHEMKALAVGGTEDHVHMLLSLPATMSTATAMRVIKSGSSRWMHETGGRPLFAWQEGYGAFSLGWSQVEATTAYIAGQAEHHKRRNFQEEFLAILKKYRIEADPRDGLE
jgi:REP element-mobilizing transposase RayT